MNRVVVTTQDVVGRRMAGPGIRAFHLARELAREFPTTLIARLEEFDPTGEAFSAIDREDPAARRALLDSRIVIGQPSREILAITLLDAPDSANE